MPSLCCRQTNKQAQKQNEINYMTMITVLGWNDASYRGCEDQHQYMA